MNMYPKKEKWLIVAQQGERRTGVRRQEEREIMEISQHDIPVETHESDW